MGQSADQVRVQLIIAGRVQGVYFRTSTVNEAQKLGLTGWVINCPDGSVKVVAEGPNNRIEQLIAWCHQGPSGARVSDVDVQWAEAENTFKRFEVRR